MKATAIGCRLPAQVVQLTHQNRPGQTSVGCCGTRGSSGRGCCVGAGMPLAQVGLPLGVLLTRGITATALAREPVLSGVEPQAEPVECSQPDVSFAPVAVGAVESMRLRRGAKRVPPTGSGSPSGNEAQHVQGQLSVDGSELDQRPVTADAAIDAGAAGYCDLLVRRRPVQELGGDGAVGQP